MMPDNNQNETNKKTNAAAGDKTAREPFAIRALRASEVAVVADVHYRAYANRFFDPAARDRAGRLYGAPLAADRPELAAGQNATYFSQYWRGFVENMDGDARARNYAFVAAQGARIIAFVKGDGAPVAGDAEMTGALSRIFADAAQCAELGSVYCDPDAKYNGAGRALCARFAACVADLGYRTMITRAYARNDSPAFFEKLGARVMGDCPIPNDYLDGEGRTRRVDIDGLWMYWDAPNFKRLAAEGRAVMRRGLS